MHLVGLPRVFYYISKHRSVAISRAADQRLQKLKIWEVLKRAGEQEREVHQLLCVSRATLYRWQKRLREKGPRGLEVRSRKPHRSRTRQWGADLEKAVLALREEYPGWGKDKLVVLLRRQGWKISSSSVGRILVSLKTHGRLHEPPRGLVKLKKRRPRRVYAVRKPRDYPIQTPGDLVEVDTLEVRPLDGRPLKHFTATDYVSRWDVLEAHERATANTPMEFLDTLQARMPFTVKAIQIDGGSEFRAGFEEACRNLGTRLFVLPPHSPILNGRVERAHRTHLEEFYAIRPDSTRLDRLNIQLYQWERTYKQIRPHQALDYLTPAEYIQKYHPRISPIQSHMY